MSSRKFKRNGHNQSIFTDKQKQDDLNISWSSSSDEENDKSKSLTTFKRNSLNTSISQKQNYKPIPIVISKSQRHNISKTCTLNSSSTNIPKEKSFKNLLTLEKSRTKNVLNSSMIDDKQVHSIITKFSLQTVPSPLQEKLPINFQHNSTPKSSFEQSLKRSNEKLITLHSPVKSSLLGDKRSNEDELKTPSKRIHLPQNDSSPILLYYKNNKNENTFQNTNTINNQQINNNNNTIQTSPIFKFHPNKSKEKLVSPKKRNNRLLRTLQNINPNDSYARSLVSKYIHVHNKKGQLLDWDQLMNHVSKMKPCKPLVSSLLNVSDSNYTNPESSPKIIITDSTDDTESISHIRRKLFTSQEEILSKNNSSVDEFIELPNSQTQINTETQNIQMISQELEKMNSELIIQSSETKSTSDVQENISYINSLSTHDLGLCIEKPNDEKLIDSPGPKSKKLPSSNSLEGRLVRLLARHRTSYNMWRHEIDSGRVTSSMATRLRVIFAWLEGTKILVDCQPIDPIKGLSETDKNQETKELTNRKYILVLNTEIMGCLPKFQVGSIISIYPPWQCLSLPSEQINFILSVTFIKQDIQTQFNPIQKISWRVLLERPIQLEDQRLLKNGEEFLQPLFSFWPGIAENPKQLACHLGSVEKNYQLSLVQGSISFVLNNIVQLLFNDNCLHLVIHRVFQYKFSNSENDNIILYTAVIGCDRSGDFCELTLGPSSKLKYTHPDFIDAFETLGKFYMFDKLQLLKRTPLKKPINTYSLFESLCSNPKRQLFLCLFDSSYSSQLSNSQLQYQTNEWIRPKSFGLSSQTGCRVTTVLRVLHTEPSRFYAIEISNRIFKSQNEMTTKNSDNSGTCRYDIDVSPIIYSIGIAPECAVEPKKNEIIALQDIVKNEDILIADKYTSRIFPKYLEEILNENYENIHFLLEKFTPEPPPFSKQTNINELINVKGIITGVDESTAFSWHFCGLCGDEQLEEIITEQFYCLNCLIELKNDTLGTRMALEIIVYLQTLKAKLKIKLLQNTIEKLLPSTETSKEGYEVSSILQKTIHLNATVHQVSEKNGIYHYYLKEIPPFC